MTTWLKLYRAIYFERITLNWVQKAKEGIRKMPIKQGNVVTLQKKPQYLALSKTSKYSSRPAQQRSSHTSDAHCSQLIEQSFFKKKTLKVILHFKAFIISDPREAQQPYCICGKKCCQ